MKKHWVVIMKEVDKSGKRIFSSMEGVIIANTEKEAEDILKKYLEHTDSDKYKKDVYGNFILLNKCETTTIYYIEYVDEIN